MLCMSEKAVDDAIQFLQSSDLKRGQGAVHVTDHTIDANTCIDIYVPSTPQLRLESLFSVRFVTRSSSASFVSILTYPADFEGFSDT